MTARVTTLVPVFDGEAYLAEAIESVLGQTRPPDRCIVVDDGSRDASAAIARRYEPAVEVISTPNGGVSAARNVGIAAARAGGTGRDEWFAICDADDVWLPHRLERQLAAVEADPAIDACFTWITEFLSPEIDPAQSVTRTPHALATSPITSALLVRLTAIDAAGPFDETLRVGDWIEWYARLVDSGAMIHMVEEVLVRRRHHLTNNSRREAAHQREMLWAMKAHLDRRRNRPT